MSPKWQRLGLAVAWNVVAIAIRMFGSRGGDAAITSGVAFLIWTVPFGVIWQFAVYDRAVELLSVEVAQAVGDVLTLSTFTLFWFLFVPALLRKFKSWA